jgi:hypothetical protein
MDVVGDLYNLDQFTRKFAGNLFRNPLAVICSGEVEDTKPVNIFETLRKEEDKAWVTLSFEPNIPVR